MLRILLLGLMITTLVGCGAHYAPVRDGTLGAAEIPIDGKHTVQSGESLYTIAWRYHKDFREIAALNNIEPPYTIYAGQKLQITGEAHVVLAAVEPVPTFQEAEIPVTSTLIEQTPIENIQTTPPQQLPQTIGQLQTPNVEPITPTEPVVKTQPESVPLQPPVITQPPAQPPMTSPTNPGTVAKWLWPAQGKILEGYGRKNKGVDISGKLGDPIYATALGEIVYSGTGLRGYGQLIIIKHNADYLSAYAHNSQLLVSEGEKVNAGQQIAHMGDSGTDSVKLHFELRYHGRPVDPQKYLGQR